MIGCVLLLPACLVWAKGSSGEEVGWVGCNLAVAHEPQSVSGVVPDKKRMEALAFTNSFFGAPVARIHDVRRYAGKLTFLAGLISELRP